MAQSVAAVQSLSSADGQLKVTFQLNSQGRPSFRTMRGDVPLVERTLGLTFADSESLADNLTIISAHRESRNQTYTIPIGKTSSANDRHQQLTIRLQERAQPYRGLEIALRAFNDGIAFRYQVPQQRAIGKFVLTAYRSSAKRPS